MMKEYNLMMPQQIYSGENAMGNIPGILQKESVKKLAVFSGQGIVDAGLLDLVLDEVKKADVEYALLTDELVEPTYEDAQKMVDQCKEFQADFIIAAGGGSVMDTAKLASILMTDEFGIKELLDDPSRARKCVPSLMIPTTAGTGSEATPNAIVAAVYRIAPQPSQLHSGEHTPTPSGRYPLHLQPPTPHQLLHVRIFGVPWRCNPLARQLPHSDSVRAQNGLFRAISRTRLYASAASTSRRAACKFPSVLRR